VIRCLDESEPSDPTGSLPTASAPWSYDPDIIAAPTSSDNLLYSTAAPSLGADPQLTSSLVNTNPVSSTPIQDPSLTENGKLSYEFNQLILQMIQQTQIYNLL
jgi:hypothetical protein